METIVEATRFKQNCLQFLESARRGSTFLITKRGVPFARLSAINVKPKKLFGSMKNSCLEREDIVNPINVEWEQDNPEPEND